MLRCVCVCVCARAYIHTLNKPQHIPTKPQQEEEESFSVTVMTVQAEGAREIARVRVKSSDKVSVLS